MFVEEAVMAVIMTTVSTSGAKHWVTGERHRIAGNARKSNERIEDLLK